MNSLDPTDEATRKFFEPFIQAVYDHRLEIVTSLKYSVTYMGIPTQQIPFQVSVALEEKFPDPSYLDLLEYLDEQLPYGHTFMYAYHVAFSSMVSLASHGATGQDFDGLGRMAVEHFGKVYR